MSVLGKVITGVVLAPIVIVVVGIGGCETRKAYYDWQVRKMCEKDGGVILSGSINVTALQAQQQPKIDGFISIPPERLARGDEPAFARYTETVLREANPRVTRWDEVIIRREDMAQIGRVVRFRRAGGDFPSIAMPSSYSCPAEEQILSQRQKMFRIQD